MCQQVLGFCETATETHRASSFISVEASTEGHADDASDADAISLSQNQVDSIPNLLGRSGTSDSDDDDDDQEVAPPRRRPAPPPPVPRPRAGSDPFVDPGESRSGSAAMNVRPPPRLPPRRPVQSSPLAPDSAAAVRLSSQDAQTSFFDPASPLPPVPPPCTRTFTIASYLTDPELDELCRLFPVWIVQSRLPVVVGKALEEGRAGAGAGNVRIANGLRDEGWRGGLWDRFKMWWRGVWRRK
jgi:hypothetical protein